ncbi:hypothetical protein NHJ13734_009815 [Beauveria thailandica]
MQLLSTLLTLSLGGFILAAPIVSSGVPGNIRNNRPAPTIGDFKKKLGEVGTEREPPPSEDAIFFPDD